jgi:hypothetical protein
MSQTGGRLVNDRVERFHRLSLAGSGDSGFRLRCGFGRFGSVGGEERSEFGLNRRRRNGSGVFRGTRRDVWNDG